MKKTLKGDLIHFAKQGCFDLIIHGQNCKHGWKKGIAHTIGLHFPQAKKSDLETLYGDKKKLGSYSYANITLDSGKNLIVVNAYTQFNYGQGNHLNIKALESCFFKIKNDFPNLHYAYPKIGAGLAGGNWNQINTVIESIFHDQQHTLVVF